MTDQYNFTVYDYDEERSGGTIHTADLTAVNFDAEIAKANALRAAMNGIMLSTVSIDAVKRTITDSKAIPADSFAQREIKWLVTAEDVVTGNLSTSEVPTANLGLLENNSPYLVRGGAVVVVAGAAAVQAYVDAYEAYALSNAGNPLSVRTIQQVGRNL